MFATCWNIINISYLHHKLYPQALNSFHIIFNVNWNSKHIYKRTLYLLIGDLRELIRELDLWMSIGCRFRFCFSFDGFSLMCYKLIIAFNSKVIIWTYSVFVFSFGGFLAFFPPFFSLIALMNIAFFFYPFEMHCRYWIIKV